MKNSLSSMSFLYRLSAFAVLILLSITSSAHAAQTRYTVELNKGKLIRLDGAAASVMVADPTIADIQVISPTAVFVNARAIGETSLLALDSSEYPVMDAVIEVTHNISKLRETARTMMPSADVSFSSIDGGLVIEGFTDTPQQSKAINDLAQSFLRDDSQQVINRIKTAGSDQVTLAVKIAEVSRTELKRFGINLSSVLRDGNLVFNLLQGRAIAAAGGVVNRNGGDNSAYFNWDGGSRVTIEGVIDALQQDGMVSILAEPNLTTTTGQTANFLAGGEVPIPTVDADGNVNIEYRQFGISLNFTPTVLSEDKISLRVTPEVSSISTVNSISVSNTATYAVPTLQVRRAETTVELASGQSFAIAGLFQNDRNNNIDKFPGLGDVPVLGTLFRSQQFQNQQTELVIIVTPYLSRPVRSAKKLMTPLDGYYPASDIDRILKGKFYQQQELTPAQIEQIGSLEGDGGFILE